MTQPLMKTGIHKNTGYRIGYTLIEMLITIAIIGILLSLLIPMVGKARLRGQSASCQNNLKQQYLSLMMFAEDHDGIMPPGSEEWPPENGLFDGEEIKMTAESLIPYADRTIWYCPSDYMKKKSKRYSYSWSLYWVKKNISTLTPKSVLSYARWYWHSDHWLSEDQSKMVNHTDPQRQLLYDGRINSLYGDGRVEWVRMTLYIPHDVVPHRRK